MASLKITPTGLNFILPITYYAIPKSLKVGDWLSRFFSWYFIAIEKSHPQKHTHNLVI